MVNRSSGTEILILDTLAVNAHTVTLAPSTNGELILAGTEAPYRKWVVTRLAEIRHHVGEFKLYSVDVRKA